MPGLERHGGPSRGSHEPTIHRGHHHDRASGPWIRPSRPSRPERSTSQPNLSRWPSSDCLCGARWRRSRWCARRRPSRRPSSPETRPSGIIGHSEPMQTVFRLIDKVAPLDCNVLIQGESGTGKEMVARALHDGGPRQQPPLRVVQLRRLHRGPDHQRALRPRKGGIYRGDQHEGRTARGRPRRIDLPRRDR